ncbi:Type I restriction modification DNA specificity domain protein [uncultured Eubacteriales bacterium]|uniref:Type I restriction modification DNA specificity domain protein n=1 Tax=uncultured Eubacteriales bacterium TaxID=172733 RepID=A0A212KEH4_9FIRM|nr:Type I restriction modification DNA specificity domain protein [uncultured Eubacteriales bacterium]
MAKLKASKKESLSFEERLEKALVADWEQPYKVPSNWVWTRLGEIGEIVTGSTPSKSNHAYYGGQFPFVKPADLDQGRYMSFASEYLSEEGKNVSRVIRKGSTSVCCIGSIGKSAYLSFEATTNQQINSIIPNINDLFIYYLTCSEYFIQELWKRSSATTISIINKGKMSEVTIPLPPLAEQQRIVDRIESLFCKLDEAKEKAQTALDSFENRKAAILHKAFTGELTAKWREENGVGLDSWVKTTLSKVTHEFKYGTSEKSDYSYLGMPVLRIPNITNDGIKFDDLKYLPHFDINEENQIHESDILIIRSNGSRELVGKCVLVPKLDQAYAYASFLIRIKLIANIIPKFIVSYLNSNDARNQMFKKAKSSAGINNINTKELGSITLNIPTHSEQTEIVLILDSIFEKEKQAKELASVIEKIDLMKKAILARAFRGELGTNDPSEESALELLKEILLKEQPKEKRVVKKQAIIPDNILKQFKTDLEEQVYRFIFENQNSTLNQILSCVSSSKHLDAMEMLTVLYEKGLIDEKNDLFFTV